jgi:hypothetical protein
MQPAVTVAAGVAASSAKAAEAVALQQAADDKKRGYPTIKGKSVAICKRKISGTEELKVISHANRCRSISYPVMCILTPFCEM